MNIKLRHICIGGLVGTTLVILKNLLAQLLPGTIPAFLHSGSGNSIGFYVEYGLIGAYYLTFALYLFKKKYIVAGVVWIFQIAAFCWYLHFIYNLRTNITSMTFNPAELSMYIRVTGIMILVTGCVLALNKTRQRVWLLVFGIVMIINAFTLFAFELMMKYQDFYVYFSALIPLPLIINYWLEIKNLKIDKSIQNVYNDVLDDI
ncbi:MAG: hypothetical protein GQ574_28545 [Crocinitomix sp.]|nr:hypothetical protein [Crocinitomix sp.]